MHRLMVKENMKCESNGQPPLTSLPKPCDYFDLIGGTSTGGVSSIVPYLIIMILNSCSFLMLGHLRMDVDTAINAYNNLVWQVFSDPKQWPGKGRFKVTKLEEVIKFVVQDVTGDPEELLLEDSNASVC